MAWLSFFFHCSATSFARGSSGLGALNNAWIDSNTVRICRAGDHLSGRREVQKKMGKKKKDKNYSSKGQICKTKGTSGWHSIGISASKRPSREAEQQPSWMRVEADRELLRPSFFLGATWYWKTPLALVNQMTQNNKIWASDKLQVQISVQTNHSLLQYFIYYLRERLAIRSAVVCSALAK